MSTTDLDRAIVSWLDEAAPRRAPEGLMAAIDRDLRRTEPRPRWLADLTERPMRRRGRAVVGSSTARRTAYLLLAALLLALAAGAVAVGSRLLAPLDASLPIGPGLNGLIAWDTNAKVFVAGPDGSSPREFIGDMGTAASATWSPDGTKIAYWAEGAPDALFVENADGSNRIRVARGLWIATNIRPSWSLDSRRLVFSTESGPNRQDEDLWIVNADGTDLHRVARPGAQERRRLLAAWSPDGRWISFQAFPGRTQTEVSHLFVIRPDGTDEHEVVVPASSFWPPGPQWEPTLKAPRLAFAGSSRAPAATIYTYDVEADTLNVVGDGAAGMSSPAWSPDGRRLAWFTSDGFTGWISIASIDAPGAPPRRISPRGIVGVLVWSPDGSKLLGSNSDGTALIVIRADGSGQPTTIPHAGSQGNPSWQWVRP